MGQEVIILFFVILLLIMYLSYKNRSKKEPIKQTLSQEEIESEIKKYLSQGNKIQAIKLLRSYTSMGLKEAKDFVEDIQSGKKPQIRINKIESIFSEQVAEEVKVLLSNGEKIGAIKRVRELTNVGLREAKDFVEEIEKILKN